MPDKLDRFTSKARRALTHAQEEALRLNHDTIRPEHLLVALVHAGDRPVVEVLREVGVEQGHVTRAVERIVVQGVVPPDSRPTLSAQMKRVIELGVEEARALGHGSIGCGHLLCGIAQVDESALIDVWRSLSVEPQRLRRQMLRHLLVKGEPPRPKPTPQHFTVPELTTDMVTAAVKDELDPLIGREQELARLIQMLCRRTKRNVLLVGEPGVGRRTLVNGLVQRMNEGNVPMGLLGRKLHRLDLDADGVAVRGMWSYNISARLTEIIDGYVADDAILFIDNLHNYFGAKDPKVETTNRLKLAIVHANLQVIATTTPSQYDKLLGPEAERDWSMQTLQIGEPSPQETLAILRGIKSRYEQHHHVVFSEEALRAAVQLSIAHMPEQFLPEKAMDLLDETGSSLQMRISEDMRAAYLALTQVRQQKQSALADDRIDEAVTLRQREVELTAQLDALRVAARETSPGQEATQQDVARVVALWTGIPAGQLLEQATDFSQGPEPPEALGEP